MKETYARARVILIFTFIVLVIGLFFVFDNKRKANQLEDLRLITERYQLANNTVYDQYQQLATTIYFGLISRFDILSLYQKLQTADTEEKNKLRQELLLQLMPRYQELKKDSEVRQLHFHLQTNESFLRFHRPEKFGDDLTEARGTVNFVNTEHSAIDGFEEGRIFNGYRFVFPIIDAPQRHLGSMEISFGPETFALSLMEQYGVVSSFHIKKYISENKEFPEEFKKNYTQSIYTNYLHDNNVSAALKSMAGRDIKTIRLGKEIVDTLLVNALSGHAISLYVPSQRRIITTIPVLNPVTRKMVAFFTVRSQSVGIEKDLQYFRMAFSLSSLLLGLALFVVYQQYNKRLILQISKEQLTSQKERLEEAQYIANLGHWDLDIAEGCLNSSDQIYRIFNLQSREQIATLKDFWKKVHPEDRDFVKTSYLSAKKTCGSYDLQHRIITTDGIEKWVRHLCTTTVDKEGTPLRSLGVIHDITVQKMQENLQLQVILQQEELKRFDSLKTMAGAIAHRFNNSMAVVMGNLELVTRILPEDSDEHEMSSDALQAAKGASQIGSMMLSYVGQRSSTLAEVSFAELTKESVTAVKSLLLSPISLQFTSPSEAIRCSLDRQQINEVLKNILTNAVESLGDGPGTIAITFGTELFSTDSFPVVFQSATMKSGMYVFCQIKDSGQGICRENLPRIFEPFYTTRFVGRGLGLALTVGIMQSHHGAIIVESELDQGTTVRVLLPVKELST